MNLHAVSELSALVFNAGQGIRRVVRVDLEKGFQLDFKANLKVFVELDRILWFDWTHAVYLKSARFSLH